MNSLKALVLFFVTSILSLSAHSQEIAFTFDDAPTPDTLHFKSGERTDKLIALLKELKIPSVIIFANACKPGANGKPLDQLRKYVDAGHVIGNHSCSHPRLDDVHADAYIEDIKKGEALLRPLMPAQKIFRYPFFNEGNDVKDRDQVRAWLKANDYLNGTATIDDDDYWFAGRLNEAKKRGNAIDYKKVEALYLEHMLGAAKFYDELAKKTIGYSPKHVILMHEVDSTILFLKPFVEALRAQGWKFISAQEAYKDKVYVEAPKNLKAGSGIIAQLALEKTGVETKHNNFKEMSEKLDKVLGL